MREEIDVLIMDLTVRLSTLGYDAIHYAEVQAEVQAAAGGEGTLFDQREYEISVGCDDISTAKASAAFVTGDSLTLIGRTFLGSYFENPMKQVCCKCCSIGYLAECCLTTFVCRKIPQSFERLVDVKEALVLLQIALYEVHHDLLIRSIDYSELSDTFGSLLNHERFNLGQEKPSVSQLSVLSILHFTYLIC